jgi:tRNA(His) guanylyltransferase
MDFKTLGDYQKWLEKNFSPEIMIPTLPVILRLDGVGFSKFTKNLTKPFDSNLTDLMVDLTKFLVNETNAVIGYHQSDEITLILYSDDRKSSIYNDGKKQKILSKLTGKAVQYFNEKRPFYLPNHNKVANFDCRIYQTPSLHDACMSLQWREHDATRNSIQMLGRSIYSDKDLFKLTTNEIQDKMMLEKNVNWNGLDARFKRGTYVRRIKMSKPFTELELKTLPINHNAHKNPNMVIERNIISVVDMPIFSTVINKIRVVFDGEEPVTGIAEHVYEDYYETFEQGLLVGLKMIGNV